MRVAVIKYNAGNIRSVAFALDRMGVDYAITDNPEEIQRADKIIFPGVGEASSTMRYLKDARLDRVIRDARQPTLGICLGMQLMCRHSEENDTECLGIFDESVRRFDDASLKVPHMGWNSLEKTSGWTGGGLEGQFMYFVHSYFIPINPFTTAQTSYELAFSAAMHKDNFFAVQFHPEKSAEAGEMVLRKFLNQNSAE